MVEIGKTYNLLTVLEESPRRAHNGGKFWKCQCKCGNIKEVRSDGLKSG